jgi:carbon monoxide dehydrogenase subunit G
LVEFDNSFEVPLPPREAWAVLTDVQRIAPCMPGAELTEAVDERTYKGRIAVRLGPVALAFTGTVQFEGMDEAARSARVKAQGSDAKGRGGANAVATFRLEPAGTGTKVLVHTDLSLSGSVAQYGRGVGMIQATAAQIMGQFAKNLKARLAEQPATLAPQPIPSEERVHSSAIPLVPAQAGHQDPRAESSQPGLNPRLGRNERRNEEPPPPLAAAKPISGFTLMVKVLWQQLLRLFGRG